MKLKRPILKRAVDMDDETVRTIALTAGIAFAAGIVVTAVFYTKNAYILKEARWTPQGDMLLTFYHRSNGWLMPNPFSGIPMK